ncbi:MAG: hypothetical protein N2255_03000, partial [Kiritimatiellae bacterium]|nr:hypothetical protein [Kiritimatiellia bacterium]
MNTKASLVVMLALLCVVAKMLGAVEDSRLAPTTWPVHSNSILAKLAASMQPGTFALLNQHGDESGYSWELVDGRAPNGHGVGSIFGYAQKAAYDPVTDTVIFSGGAHDGVTETIRYDITSNRWIN